LIATAGGASNAEPETIYTFIIFDLEADSVMTPNQI
jgi:hypothetical protein